MNIRNRMLALVLAVVLVLGIMPVTAMAEGFTRAATWQDDPFADVTLEDWFYENVKGLYELGLMIGYGNGLFQPGSSISMAETLTVAARIHAISATGEENFVQEDPWYQVYADYALAEGLIDEAPEDMSCHATRLEFAHILARTMPEEELPPINDVPDGSIPDLAEDEAVYLLYRAGVLMGDDEAGTFRPNSDIKRSEVAAIVTRMILPELRHGAQPPDTDVTDPAETQPQEPTEPVETEPQEPTEPEETEPQEPTEPEETEPQEPTEPEETEPQEPTEPEETEPQEPTEPEETEPQEPTEPEVTEPDNSVNVSVDIELDENGTVKSQVDLDGTDVKATVPAGVAAQEGAQILTLTVTEMEATAGSIPLEGTESLSSYDVHIEGVAADNQVPILVELGMALEPGFNLGNVTLYHVEDGVTNPMTQVMTLAEVDAHNEFYYDPATGVLTMALATFSEIAVVADEPKAWEGNFDYSWYTNAVVPADGEAVTEYIIANADQLAAFGAIVGGMNGQTQDSFAGKTVKLIADINLGDKESENIESLIFYPIGYYNSTGSYEKVSGGSVTSSVNSFEGTFDGNGHTIANFYQNTWEMFGDYNSGYSGTPNHYSDGMGLFGYVVNGTVKNLTVENFSSDGEFTPTGVIAAYAVNSTFENIALVNCNPRVYNTGNGGIVGIGGNSSDPDTYKLTFTNITIDNTNKITALWGSWDVACGGLVGMFRGAGHVYMTNCHVAAQIDVYNDVCGNYQYYWYRYAGMMVGTNHNMVEENGYTVPETDKFHAEDCTVHFGEWNDYYYCELVANSLASYTHDHQFSRLDQVDSVDDENMTVTVGGETTAIPTSGRYNYVVVNGEASTENATCYHFVDGTVWNHEDAGEETVDVDGDGDTETVLKEDRQHYYLPFNQLFTGYGWGVKHIPVYNGENYAFEGITILDRTDANSVKKFEKADTAKAEYSTGTTVTIGELFKAAAIADEKITIKPENVQVTVSPVGDTSTAGGTYTANTTDWTLGTLTFSGAGLAEITIQDYYFCTPTTINVTIKERMTAEKFEVAFDHDADTDGNQNYVDSYLYRVGNANTVTLSSLFEAKADATITDANVTVTVETITGASGTVTPNTTDWTKGKIQFSGTGVVKVTITDNDYCIPTELYLEVLDAYNRTTASFSGNSVLLNDVYPTSAISTSGVIYGNGFTVNMENGPISNGSGAVFHLYDGAVLKNLKIVGKEFTTVASSANSTNYGVSAVRAWGTVTIENCYISGCRSAVYATGTELTIKDSVIANGVYANIDFSSGTLNLHNVTTINQPHTVDNTPILGLGIVGNMTASAGRKVNITGTLTQYNWVSQADCKSIKTTGVDTIFNDVFTKDQYAPFRYTYNGTTYANTGILSLCSDFGAGAVTGLPSDYTGLEVSASIMGISADGYAWAPGQAGTLTDDDMQYHDTVYEWTPSNQGTSYIPPAFDYSNADLEAENGVVQISYESGSSYTLSADTIKALLTAEKYGETLSYQVTMDGVDYTGKDIVFDEAASQTYTITYTIVDNLIYGTDGTLTDTAYEVTKTLKVFATVVDKSADAPTFTFHYGTNGSASAGTPHTTQPTDTYTSTIKQIGETYYIMPNVSAVTENAIGSQTVDGETVYYPIVDGINVRSGSSTDYDFTRYYPIFKAVTISDNGTEYSYSGTKELPATVAWVSATIDTGNTSSALSTEFGLYNDQYLCKVQAKAGNEEKGGTSVVKFSYTALDGNTYYYYVGYRFYDEDEGGLCLTADTLITLADGTQKRIDALTFGDKILTWDFFTGSYVEKEISLLVNHGEALMPIANMVMSDGSVLRIVGEHGVFDYGLNQFVYITPDNVADYVEHEFVQHSADGAYNIVTLVDGYVTEEYVGYYSVSSAGTSNAFASGLLTVAPPEDFYNWIEMGDKLLYDAEQFQQDVETYGLYTYDDFKDYVTYEQFVDWNGAYLKIPVEKGYFTFDYILELIDLYKGWMPNN